MNTSSFIDRKKHLLAGLWVTALILVISKTSGLVSSPLKENIWWTGLLIFGAMIIGFLFQPMVKARFPGLKDPTVVKDRRLHLKDHETLFGYYPIVAMVILAGALLVSPLLYPAKPIFEVKSVHFWWSVISTGVLNVFIFYFFTKGLRYGDVSLVSVTLAIAPLFVIPISFIVFALVGSYAPIGNPRISAAGAWGIILTVAALIINIIGNKRKGLGENPPPRDFFAHHPVLSGILAMLIASVAVNFDKVAVESGTPFLAGIIMSGVVAVITFLWTLFAGGLERMKFIVNHYGRSFITVGVVYGIIILVMNVALFGANVNYYASIKGSAAVFGTFYGVYVLREGQNSQEKLTRIAVSIMVIIGILLITFKG